MHTTVLVVHVSYTEVHEYEDLDLQSDGYKHRYETKGVGNTPTKRFITEKSAEFKDKPPLYLTGNNNHESRVLFHGDEL